MKFCFWWKICSHHIRWLSVNSRNRRRVRCVVHHGVADFWQRSVWRSAGCATRHCQEWRDRQRVRWEGIVCLLGGEGRAGEGGWGCQEEKLICLQLLSLIAWACLTGSITVNHCGSTRLPRHTIPSPAPRQIISFTSGACWESLEKRSVLKAPNHAGVWGFVWQGEVLLKGWGDPYLARILGDFEMCGNTWLSTFTVLIISDIWYCSLIGFYRY